MGPYRISSLRNGILTGHNATLKSTNLIVENIMINDVRNGSVYQCVIIPAQGMIGPADIIDESDPTYLYVAGEYQHTDFVCSCIDTTISIHYCIMVSKTHTFVAFCICGSENLNAFEIHT